MTRDEIRTIALDVERLGEIALLALDVRSPDWPDRVREFQSAAARFSDAVADYLLEA